MSVLQLLRGKQKVRTQHAGWLRICVPGALCPLSPPSAAAAAGGGPPREPSRAAPAAPVGEVGGPGERGAHRWCAAGEPAVVCTRSACIAPAHCMPPNHAAAPPHQLIELPWPQVVVSVPGERVHYVVKGHGEHLQMTGRAARGIVGDPQVGTSRHRHDAHMRGMKRTLSKPPPPPPPPPPTHTHTHPKNQARCTSRDSQNLALLPPCRCSSLRVWPYSVAARPTSCCARGEVPPMRRAAYARSSSATSVMLGWLLEASLTTHVEGRAWR